MAGLSNKPVAEAFDKPQANLELRSDRQFRPVGAILILAIQSIAGSGNTNPEAYHLFGLAVHITTVLAVFLLAYRLMSSQNSALAVALIFALYPRHHEVVFWVAAYTHIIMTAYLLFSFNLYLKWRRVTKTRWLFISLILFVLAILGNEAAVVGILLFLMYELFWERDQLKADLKGKVLVLIHLLWPFVAVVLIYLSLFVIALGGGIKLCHKYD